MPSHVLGIDAGGSKTVCLLANADGQILSEGRGPGANLHAAGELEAEKVLHQVMEAALGDRDLRPEVVCLGMAGVDREDDARIVTGMVRRLTRGSRPLVVNDALVALVAGAGPSPGIVVIAGTGSIAYGRNAGWIATRAGGWGHAIGDEGSGYWIGRHAMTAVVRALDGRGPATRLTGDVLAHFNVSDGAGLVQIVYHREVPRKNVAMLGPLVQRASDQGDAVASQILERAAEELTMAAQSVATRLGMRGEAFPFVLSGSVFRVVPSLVKEMQRRLIEVAPRADVRLLEEEPAIGAVALALEELRGGVRLPRYAD
jgi:N-acetylglucosamine kinase